ncbi:MAG: glycosyl hydrolase [Gemmatimonadota bacterium]|nr:glycosyl hydrolase [Gemmatimonadota bacterium]
MKASQFLSRLLVLITVSAVPTLAQGPATPYDSLAFTALKWRELGPFRGGRSVAVAGSASRPREYYLGTTGGGVFKTTDGGTTWKPVTDKYFGGTIGSIAVSESNPNIVYVGTGESPIRGNVSHGDGVFKSTDAGKTWAFTGLGDTRQISRVRIDPKNPDIVYVGAQGHVWGPNAERGVFKTTDGGKTWKKILFRNDSTGITDLVIDPHNSQTLYAAFWQAYREPWKLVSGGAGSGIFKSTDGGDHWTEITHNTGLPSGIIGNIGITASPAKEGRLWAVIEADSGGVFRSDDAGATWTKTNSDRGLRQRAWYYSRVFADPKDPNGVYGTNVGFMHSTDGGKTFKSISVPHGDNHDLWISPTDPKRMIESNDGGATVTVDGGESWTPEYQPTAQFYHVETTTDFPYHVCGAQQDNSTLCGPSAKDGGVGIDDWQDVGGGESGYIAVRPDSPNVVFAGSYGGLLTRFDTRTGLSRDVNPWPDNPMGHDAADAKYRFQWTFPIVLSPWNPSVMYMGSSVIFRTTDEGQHWTAISPDLTRHDPRTLGASGGPITKDQTSVEYFGTVFAIAESPVQKGVIWAGSDDGMIHVTRDGGKTWTDITPKGLPEWTRISIIEPSHYSAGTAYVAANRYQLDDMRPYMYRTTDFGRTWTPIVDGIPSTEFTRVVREDPARKGLLYAGTERGVWVSFDDGGHWQTLRRNLPIVPVHDLAVKNGDLIAATHGRGFWIMDNISPLRQLTPAIVASPAHLFAPDKVYRASFYGGATTGATGGPPRAANPPSGAVIYYWVKSPRQVVTLDFLDAKGNLIRHFTSDLDSAGVVDSVEAGTKKAAVHDSLVKAGINADSIKVLEKLPGEGDRARSGRRGGPQTPRVPNKQGLNTFDWNLRYPDAATFKGLVFWGGGVTGPLAPPGTYSVRMTTGGVTQTQKFELLKDPRVHSTQQELNDQFAFLVKMRDTLSAANNAVRTIRNVRWQIGDRSKRLTGSARTSFDAQTAPLLRSLSTIESTIYQTQSHASEDPLNYPIRINNKIAALAGVVGGAAYKPTDQSYEVYTILSAQLDAQLRALQTTLAELKPVNAILTSNGAATIAPSTAEIKGAEQAPEEDGGDSDAG